MLQDYKKVLIIGQPFNTNTGGGITLTNLFAGRPENTVAVAAFGGAAAAAELKDGVRLYQLGLDEVNVKFPFNFFKKRYLSGEIKAGSGLKSKSERLKKTNSKVRLVLMQTLLSLTKMFGIYEYIESYNMSKQFRCWIETYSVDVIYTQLGSMPLMNFIEDISSEYKIPIIVHIMDDWPSTILGYLGLFLKRAINKRVNTFFDKCSLHLAISSAMAIEYSKRYGHKWFVFHNSIDISKWGDLNVKIKKTKKFRVLYMGRISVANSKAIVDFAKSVQNFKDNFIRLEFHLYSPTQGKIINYLDSFENVICHQPIDYFEIPNLMRQFDLLLLPLDFSARGMKFAKYSMPTKMSEYMISGVPIFVFAPSTCAVSLYAQENEVAFVCGSNKKEDIERALRKIIFEDDLRIKFSEKAFERAVNSHDINKEHQRFESLIRDVKLK